VILQQAEAAGLVEKVTRMQHGRRLTQAGRDFLDSIDGAYEKKLDSDSWIVRNVPVSEAVVEQVEDDVAGDDVEVVKEDKDGK